MNEKLKSEVERKIKKTMKSFDIPPSQYEKLKKNVYHDYGQTQESRRERIQPDVSGLHKLTRRDIVEIYDGSKDRRDELSAGKYQSRKESERNAEYARKNWKWFR